LELTSYVDGSTLNVSSNTVNALTLVHTDVRHGHVTDHQLCAARDDVTDRDPAAFLSSDTDQITGYCSRNSE